MDKKVEGCLEDINNVPKVVVRDKAVVGSPAGNQEANELI